MSLTDLSSPQGIDRFYYGKVVPERGTAIAQITSSVITPAQKVNILNNTSLQTGSLYIWNYNTGDSSTPDFSTGDYGLSVTISGSLSYILGNRFFEITNVFDTQNNPLYYKHIFYSGTEILNNIGSAVVLDLQGNIVTSGVLNSSIYYHSMDGKAYQIRYYDSNTGITKTVLLNYQPVMSSVLTGNVLTVPTTGNYSIRFTQPSGYEVITPYNSPSYLPWFPLVNFPIGSTPYEYNTQNFNPIKPYIQGSYIVGTVISDLNQAFPNVIEFDRLNIYNNPVNSFPDILIFDQYSNFKYALQGNNSGNINRGNLYSWTSLKFNNIDPYKARVQVSVDLESTDIVYAFYSYSESNILFTQLDLNPVTNPLINGNIIYFYYRLGGVDTVFYQIFSQTSPPNLISGATNDTSPPTWLYNETYDISTSTWTPNTSGEWGSNDSSTVFSIVQVGNGYNASDFTVTDVRTRGGGLTPANQDLPIVGNFWDLGNLDGRPYPIGGTIVIYFPLSLQSVLSKDQIRNKVLTLIPQGVYPTIRYIDSEGNETV